MTLKEDSNSEEKLTFRLKNNMRNLVNFKPNSGKSESLYRDGLLKNCEVKNDLWF